MRPPQDNDVFHAIAHPARRAMLLALRRGEKAAGELAEPFDMTFGAISQHLKVLKEAELVLERRNGRQRLYRLQSHPLREVIAWADEFAACFNTRLDALEAHLDRKHGRGPKGSR
jgi:DNA-binding transcriptional ArsR family regulator